MERIVSAKEIYAQPAPSDDLTHAICSHTFSPSREYCGRCPHSETDRDGDEVIRGCRAQAEEIARVAMVVLRREGWSPPSS